MLIVYIQIFCKFVHHDLMMQWHIDVRLESYNFYSNLDIRISLFHGRARGLDIDRLRSLNSAINDCVHRLRGSRSNEYDERVAALGERAVHTDLRLIDWTPFHSTMPRHRGSTPAPSIPPHELSRHR